MRFLFFSALQALANYGSYLLLLTIAPWWLAFIVAVVIGIGLQTLLQIRSTFNSKVTLVRSRRYITYQLGYLVVFATILSLVIGWGVPPAYAPLLVLAIVTPANFVLTRWVITR